MRAQEIHGEYRTMDGQMIVTGHVGDSTLQMKTNRLVIALNYETAELVIRINPSTVKNVSDPATKDPFVNTNTQVLFEGKLSLDRVITQKHPPLDFDVEGYLFNDDQWTWIRGTGHLEHIHGDEYACVLNMEFEIAPGLLSIQWPGDDQVKVQIIQTILKPENE